MSKRDMLHLASVAAAIGCSGVNHDSKGVAGAQSTQTSDSSGNGGGNSSVIATGGTLATGGSRSSSGTAFGGGVGSGGALSTGGNPSSSGGTLHAGGSVGNGGSVVSAGSGGSVAAGGNSGTSGNHIGGTSNRGGSSNAGATNSSTGGSTGSTGVGGSGVGGTGVGGSGVGGRGFGICPGGSYPAPDLSGTAAVITSETAGGQYEGTLWLSTPGVLLFSAMNTSVSGSTVVPAAVMRLTPPSAVDTPIADSGSNGLAIDFVGTVFAGSQKIRGIVKLDLSAGTTTTLVDTDSNGHHFNSVNDLTIRTDGTIYFTDPDYQLSGRTNETGIKGVYRYSPSKQISLVDDQFNQPNGVTLAPDESVLYVADTAANRLRRFSLAADGSASGKADFATLSSPDGGAIDCAGNLYWASNATPGKIYVFSPAGTQLGTIALGASDKPTNVAFGGADHKTLYVSTSPRKLYSVALNIPGFPY